MPAFTPNEWLIVLLAFVLGLLIGMMLLAGSKWKQRYKEESRSRRDDQRRIEELETENRRLAAATHSADGLRRSDAGHDSSSRSRIDDRVDRDNRHEADRVADRDRSRDPASIFFCHKLGLDYVSCSPYRVPIARLAAAQAALGGPLRTE